MTDEHHEKRRFPRIPVEYAVLIRQLGPGESEEFVKARNVGLGGCMVVSDVPLGLGSGVDLLISVRGGVVKARGRVVYEIPKGKKAFEVGVEFLRIATGDLKLLQALFEGQPKEAEG